MFQAFKDEEEYAQTFDDLLKSIPKKKRYIITTFMMRLHQSIKEGRAI